MASPCLALPSLVPPAPPAQPPVTVVAGAAPVCLDYLKGRCARKRCRFLHPDLAGFKQLSGAVQAQSGRQVCDVWALTGHCKFGPACSRLHPVVLKQPTQSTMTLLLPVAVVPKPGIAPLAPTPVAFGPPRSESEASPTLPPTPLSPPDGLASPASERCGTPAPPSPLVRLPSPGPIPAPPPVTLPPPAQSPNHWTVPEPLRTSTAPALPQPVNPLHPHHVSPFSSSQLGLSDPQPADLPGWTCTVLKALEAGKGDAAPLLPISKGLAPAAPASERGRSLSFLFGSDAELEQPAPGPTPAPDPTSGGATAPPRRPNPQHARDRSFLNMLRDLHMAGL